MRGARKDTIGRAAASALPFLWIIFFVCLTLASEPPGYALFLLAATLLHETGHLLAFLLCGAGLPTFRGRSFGFLLTPERGMLSYKKEAFVAAAGPIFNLLAALSLVPALRAGRAVEANFCFLALNLLTALFNLLPITGFDGGRVLSALLHEWVSPRVADGVCGALSAALCLLFYFCALFLSLVAGAGPYPLLLSLFLLYNEAGRHPWLFEDLREFGRKSKVFPRKCKNPLPHPR